MSISVNKLSKRYGEQLAVDQVSFTVNKGEIVGFLGPNGAGKSTTMKMITGYLEADSGSVQVAGLDVVSNGTETRKKIGYLPEANPLYFDMYIREYLHFIGNVHGLHNQKQAIEDVIGLVGLGPESKKKIGQLSKGYKQRVGLAAALLHDPEVLILDEPTTGLDPNQIIEIRAVIKQLGKNKTVLFSSHIMQEVEAICDRVIIINKGKIVADDSLQNLRASAEGTAFVKVEFKQQVDVDKLKKIPGAITVENLQGSLYSIRCDNSEDLKKQLLQFSLANHLDIISLQGDTKNLEAVFKLLTT